MEAFTGYSQSQSEPDEQDDWWNSSFYTHQSNELDQLDNEWAALHSFRDAPNSHELCAPDWPFQQHNSDYPSSHNGPGMLCEAFSGRKDSSFHSPQSKLSVSYFGQEEFRLFETGAGLVVCSTSCPCA